MLNTGLGGTVFLGVTDDARAEGFLMTRYSTASSGCRPAGETENFRDDDLALGFA